MRDPPIATRVIGVGQRLAGDDGVGVEVVRRMRSLIAADGIELMEVTDPAALIPLLETDRAVVLVDALVGGGEPGAVLRLTPEALAARRSSPWSTHGLDVTQAIRLARTLLPRIAPRIDIVAVSVAPPDRFKRGLSSAIESAIPRAIAEALACAARDG